MEHCFVRHMSSTWWVHLSWISQCCVFGENCNSFVCEEQEWNDISILFPYRVDHVLDSIYCVNLISNCQMRFFFHSRFTNLLKNLLTWRIFVALFWEQQSETPPVFEISLLYINSGWCSVVRSVHWLSNSSWQLRSKGREGRKLEARSEGIRLLA